MFGFILGDLLGVEVGFKLGLIVEILLGFTDSLDLQIVKYLVKMSAPHSAVQIVRRLVLFPLS